VSQSTRACSTHRVRRTAERSQRASCARAPTATALGRAAWPCQRCPTDTGAPSQVAPGRDAAPPVLPMQPGWGCRRWLISRPLGRHSSSGRLRLQRGGHGQRRPRMPHRLSCDSLLSPTHVRRRNLMVGCSGAARPVRFAPASLVHGSTRRAQSHFAESDSPFLRDGGPRGSCHPTRRPGPLPMNSSKPEDAGARRDRGMRADKAAGGQMLGQTDQRAQRQRG